MPEIVVLLSPQIRAFEQAVSGPLHIVSHSLGGLVARALITASRPQRLGRVVMLAPPNKGSELADLLRRWRVEGLVLGPVSPLLCTVRADAAQALLGPVDFDLGVIAGDRPIDPLLSRGLPRPNDGKVSVAATRVDGMRDHLVLPVSHTLMVHDARVGAQALAFIRDGAFRR